MLSPKVPNHHDHRHCFHEPRAAMCFQRGALYPMARYTLITTSRVGMARAPDNRGKELLLQSTARAPPLQLMHCQHCSRKQLLQCVAQHKPMLWQIAWQPQDYLAQSVSDMLQSTPLSMLDGGLSGRPNSGATSGTASM